ncbi:fimbrillin family protein [Bacteroides caecigallinarum]|nr:fimbrillin family protein [Bacteroides caecigallinarum]
MKTSTLLSAITVLILAACTKENFTENNPKETQQVTITGNSMSDFKDIDSRASTVSYIPEDGSILFFSEGGVKANGDTLYYTDGKWSGLKDDNWYIDDGDANITAYYPIIHSSEDLYYENGELKDVVCYRNSVKAGEQISLSFNHIFAKFIINLEKGLNDTIKKVHVNIPQKVNSINLKTCEYTTTENNSGSFTFDKNDNCKYEFFIPAMSGMSLSFKIESNNIMSKEVVINEDIFERGYEYICNVSKSKGNGIYTTKDFIAFTNLINGEAEYEGKKLKDLYTEINGEIIFNLYNDLNFTDEEAEKISIIKEFNYTFNGNNHTLSNLKINQERITNLGLFGENKENGYIRDITIDNCKFSLPEYSSYSMGCLFVGRNAGTIDNCHVTNGIIDMYQEKQKNYAGFVAVNTGTIINSSISNLQLESNNGVLGIFVYQNNGDILNCRINNNINKYTTTSNSSCICTNNTKDLYNVFVSEYKSKYYGICYKNNKGNYSNCILPYNYTDKTIHEDIVSANNIRNAVYYLETVDEYSRIANELNQWIEDNKSKYSQFTFRKWKTDPSEKVIFE